MISGFNSAVSALQTFGTRLNSNSNNIANANTNEFKRTRVLNTSGEEPTGGVTAQVQKIETPGAKIYEETENGYEEVELSNVDLATEITDMNLNSNLYKANLKTIETVDEMAGELLNLKA